MSWGRPLPVGHNRYSPARGTTHWLLCFQRPATAASDLRLADGSTSQSVSSWLPAGSPWWFRSTRLRHAVSRAPASINPPLFPQPRHGSGFLQFEISGSPHCLPSPLSLFLFPRAGDPREWWDHTGDGTWVSNPCKESRPST